jgi:hypothetical protein
LSLLKGLEVMLSSFYFFEIMPKFCLPQLWRVLRVFSKRRVETGVRHSYISK